MTVLKDKLFIIFRLEIVIGNRVYKLIVEGGKKGMFFNGNNIKI